MSAEGRVTVSERRSISSIKRLRFYRVFADDPPVASIVFATGGGGYAAIDPRKGERDATTGESHFRILANFFCRRFDCRPDRQANGRTRGEALHLLPIAGELPRAHRP